jgi:predicted DNA binding protein
MEDQAGEPSGDDSRTNGDTDDTSQTESSSNSSSRQGGADPERTPQIISGEFTLSHPDIALTQAAEEVPDVTIRPEHVVPDPDGTFLVFSVFGGDIDAFVRALDDDDTVSDPLVLSNMHESRCYRVTLTGEPMTVTQLVTRNRGRLVDVVGSGGEWEIGAQFPDRDTFMQFRKDCTDRNVSFRLHRLSWDDGDTDLQRNVLSTEQLDALKRAYEAGYFDVPRSVSQLELADQLEISPSAVSQRLRRATSRLVEATLDTEES